MIAMIACIGPTREIGYKGELIYKTKEDLQWFKTITRGETVVMGRKTFASIGHPLAGRRNIVLSRERHTEPATPTLQYYPTIQSILDGTEGMGGVWIIGGASVYEQFMPYADFLYIDRVLVPAAQVDTYFPEWGVEEWYPIAIERYFDAQLKGYALREVWKRRK